MRNRKRILKGLGPIRLRRQNITASEKDGRRKEAPYSQGEIKRTQAILN